MDVIHLILLAQSDSDVTICSWQKEELCNAGPFCPCTMSLSHTPAPRPSMVGTGLLLGTRCKTLELLLVGLSGQNGKTQRGLLPPSLLFLPC